MHMAHFNVYSLFKQDKLYVAKDFNMFSTEKLHDKMFKFTESINTLYPGYKFDEKYLIRADTAKTVNLDQLLDILKSKDEELLKNNSWIFDGEARYLDGKNTSNARISYITYPRVGSTMMRKYF